MKQIVVLLLLAANSLQDIRRKEILFWPTLCTFAAGALLTILQPPATDKDGFGLALLLALLPGFGFFLLSLATRGKVGGGDAIAVCAIGAWAGAEATGITVLTALVLVAAGAPLLGLHRSQKKELPFLPFLLAGYVLQWIWFEA